MTDDRILLIHSNWAGGPNVRRLFPAMTAVDERLEAFLPVDHWTWPFHEGRKVDDPVAWLDQQVAQLATSQHHIVDLGGSASERLFSRLHEKGRVPRSFILAGFYGRPATLRAAGLPDAAAFQEVAMQVTSNPQQIVGVVTQGADEATREAIVRALQADVDYASMRKLMDWARELSALRDLPTLDCPALYLELPVGVPQYDVAALLRGYLPNLRTDSLELYGSNLHEADGGHEVADKVLPFIKEVIAEREANAQT